MNTKDCKTCEQTKPIKAFEKNRRVCEKCRYQKRKQYMKEYYKKHYVKKRKPKVQNVKTLNAPSEQQVQ